MKSHICQIIPKILLCFFISVFSVACSGLFETEESRNRKNTQLFETGMKNFKMRDYQTAIENFRRIPPESPLYNQSLRMIQKVPFQQGNDAYQQKKYELALQKLTQVPPHSPEYEEAQEMIETIEWERLESEYEKASASRRVMLLHEMVERSIEDDDQQLLQMHLFRAGDTLMSVKDTEQRKSLLELMQRTVDAGLPPQVMKTLLDQILIEFPNMVENNVLRPHVFQLIASLKLGLQ